MNLVGFEWILFRFVLGLRSICYLVSLWVFRVWDYALANLPLRLVVEYLRSKSVKFFSWSSFEIVWTLRFSAVVQIIGCLDYRQLGVSLLNYYLCSDYVCCWIIVTVLSPYESLSGFHPCSILVNYSSIEISFDWSDWLNNKRVPNPFTR